MTRKRSSSTSETENVSEPTAFEKAVAIMRRRGDSRVITPEEVGQLTHYTMLHAQQKGVSEEEAITEIAAEFQRSPSLAAAEAPVTPIHSHTIVIVTDPIPSIGEMAHEGIAKVRNQDYIASIRHLIRHVLEDSGLHQLAFRLSVHPVEVRTENPDSRDYWHIVTLAGDQEAIGLAKQLWPSAKPH